jgi:hypothetical protein
MRTFKSLSLSLFVFVLFAFTFQLRAQDSEKSFMVYPTFGVGIGFFYPKDVNTYIEDYMFPEALESYNTEIYMYLEVKGGVTFRLKNVDFGVIMEYDIAPKFVVVTGGGEDDTYAFSRYSPELSANYYIPGKSGKNAFFIGAGINYSFMEFEGIKASAPGVKLQLGYSMQFGKFNMQPYGAFRYVKGTDDDVIWGMGNDKFELNYTGGQIGIILSFHQRMLYR